MRQHYQVYVPSTPVKVALGFYRPHKLQWPDDYRRVTSTEARDPDDAFGQLQHGSDARMPMPQHEPSFSVGFVLVDESGQALRCLSGGWEKL